MSEPGSTNTDTMVLDLERWSRRPDPADKLVLDRCVGPTLDVGCGPGRMVLELTRRGVPALGIDVCPQVVRQIRDLGGMALRRSIFEPIPGEGRWQTALLLDGCVGIGGEPDVLLSRVRELLDPMGVVFVEHDPEATREESLTVTVRDGTGADGPELDWAVIGEKALDRAAAEAGLDVFDMWTSAGRAFAGLRLAGRGA